MDEGTRALFLDDARGALAVLREADKVMLDKGMTAAEDAMDEDISSYDDSYSSYRYLRSDAPYDIWQAMIDAALTDTPAQS